MLAALTLLTGLLVAAYIASPLWWSRVPRPRTAVPVLGAAVAVLGAGALLERRDALLRELKELEFDLRMDKIEQADYDVLRAVTAARAGAVLEEIERRGLGDAATAPVRAAAWWRELEAEAEIQIARARRRRAGSKCAGWECAGCGRMMKNDDAFCASCGKAKAAHAAA